MWHFVMPITLGNNFLAHFVIPVTLSNHFLSHFVITIEWSRTKGPGPVVQDLGLGPKTQALETRTQDPEPTN